MDWYSIIADSWWQQLLMLGVLGIALLLFIKDRFRYDVVALLVMIIIMLLGILPYETVLSNFGHPVIIIVGCMFIISQALVQSGLIDGIVNRLPFLHQRPLLALLALVILVTIISGFVNNIGALAMVIPVALHIARKNNTPVAFFLLPLAFASHLGGYLTLIGTPRNVLISDFRAGTTGVPFEMFDFLPVGLVIAFIGIIFIVFYAFYFLPRRSPYLRDGSLQRIFVTEVRITKSAKLLDISIKKARVKMKDAVELIQVYRNFQPMYYEDDSLLHEDDILIIAGTEEDLTNFVEKNRLELTGQRAIERNITNADDYVTLEVMIPPYAKTVGWTWDAIPLIDRFGVNFIGIFRRHNFKPTRLSEIKLLGNDIILLQGRRESLTATIERIGFLPIADSQIQLGRTNTILGTSSIAIVAVIAASFHIAPLPIIFLCAVAVLIGSGLISLKQAYESIEWPVLVLLAGMITLGMGLEASGADDSIAHLLLLASDQLGPVWLLLMVLIATMLMSDFINTTASAVIMAPIAVIVATNLGVSIDPFLMAVAVGASSAFLTPVGHESNALVMQKGGYRFSDFTKMGWPLELLIIAASIPMILYVWPL
jgi:di/tricarboxylate transporter